MATSSATPASTVALPGTTGITPAVSNNVGATPVVTATPTIDHGQSVASTAGDQYANGVRDTAVIGSYANTGVNGYQNTPGTPQLSDAARAAQAKNGALYNQQQAAATPQGTQSPGQSTATPPPLSFGENVAQPKVGENGNQIVNFDAAKNSFGAPTENLDAENAKRKAQGLSYGSSTQPTIDATTTPGSTTTATTTPQATPAQDFSKQMTDFMTSFKGDMGEFLNNQNNMYTSILGDMKTLVQGQTTEMQQITAEHIANMEGYAKAFQAERDAGIASANANAEAMTSFAKMDKDNLTKQNDIAAQQSHSQYGDQITMATENQSRYLGYLTSKFDAAGMSNSSAGMMAIGKMLAAGQMGINALARDDTNAQMMFLSKGTDIANTFFKNAFQIESQRQQSTAQIRSETNKQLMDIENNKFASEEKKLMDTYSLVKEYNAAKIEIMSKSFSNVMAVKDNSLKEAQFAHGVVQDSIHNQQWTEQFDQNAKQFGMTYALQERQENRAYDAQQTAATGNLWLNGQNTGTRALAGKSFDQQVAQFGQTMAYQYAGLNQAHSQFEQQLAQSSSQFSQNLQQSADQFNKTYGLNLGTQAFSQKDALLKNLQSLPNAAYDPSVQKAIRDVTNDMAGNLFGQSSGELPENLKKSKYTPTLGADGSVRFNIGTGVDGGQCGRLVNDATGKPGFMTDTYEEKMKVATNKVPQAGGAFVQAISGKGAENGHTGMVEKVYGDPNRPDGIDILDSNYGLNEKTQRAHINITYGQNGQPIYTRNGKNVALTGFTEGVQPARKIMPALESLGNVAKQAYGAMTGDSAMFNDASAPMNQPDQSYDQLGIGQVGPATTTSAVNPNITNWAQSVYSDPSRMSQVPAELKTAVNNAVTQLQSSGAPKQSAQKPLSDTSLTMLSDAAFLPKILQELEGTINKSGQKDGAAFGPMSNLYNLNPFDTTQQIANADLSRSAQLVGKFMEGGVLRKEDEAKYAKMLPGTTDTKEVAQGKLQAVRNMLQAKLQGYLDTDRAAGYDTRPIEEQLAKMGALGSSGLQVGEIQVRDKNGVLGAIPESEFDAKLYTKVQ